LIAGKWLVEMAIGRACGSLFEIIDGDFPADNDADQTANRTDDEIAHESEAETFPGPPAYIAADGGSDKDQQFSHAGDSLDQIALNGFEGLVHRMAQTFGIQG
jgi:hypothetical protein